MNNVRTKLTLITINGRTIMVDLPVDNNGKARVDLYTVMRVMGIPEGSCIWQFGSLPRRLSPDAVV